MKHSSAVLLFVCGVAVFVLLAGLSEYTEDNSAFDMPKIHKKENENWYADSSNVQADSSLFHQKARGELEQTEKRILELKQKNKETPADAENQRRVAELEKKLERARKAYKNYAASSAVSSSETRAAFETSWNALNGQFQKAASAILPPEKAGRLALESKVSDRTYQIRQLKSALGNLNEDLKTQRQLESRIAKLEEVNKQAAAKLEKMKPGGETPWEDFQKEMEGGLSDFDKDYLKTLADVKKSR